MIYNLINRIDQLEAENARLRTTVELLEIVTEQLQRKIGTVDAGPKLAHNAYDLKLNLGDDT